MKAIWRWRQKIARRGILAALLMTTLLAGGCAYNGYYTDYPYYGDYYYPYSYPYYENYYPIPTRTTEATIHTTAFPAGF